MKTRTEAMLQLLTMDPEWRDPNEERAGVTAIQHALQCATHAVHHIPHDHEMVCAALLHDAARPLSDVNHGEVMAMILRDVVRTDVFNALYHHGVFANQLLNQEPLEMDDHTGWEESAALASWDAASFNPDYETYQLGWFIPFLQKLFGEPVAIRTPDYANISDYCYREEL